MVIFSYFRINFYNLRSSINHYTVCIQRIIGGSGHQICQAIFMQFCVMVLNELVFLNNLLILHSFLAFFFSFILICLPPVFDVVVHRFIELVPVQKSLETMFGHLGEYSVQHRLYSTPRGVQCIAQVKQYTQGCTVHCTAQFIQYTQLSTIY